MRDCHRRRRRRRWRRRWNRCRRGGRHWATAVASLYEGCRSLWALWLLAVGGWDYASGCKDDRDVEDADDQNDEDCDSIIIIWSVRCG